MYHLYTSGNYTDLTFTSKHIASHLALLNSNLFSFDHLLALFTSFCSENKFTWLPIIFVSSAKNPPHFIPPSALISPWDPHSAQNTNQLPSAKPLYAASPFFLPFLCVSPSVKLNIDSLRSATNYWRSLDVAWKQLARRWLVMLFSVFSE